MLTPAYNTPLSKEGLQKWREEFWETRTTRKKDVWSILKTACSEDHETAKKMLQNSKLQIVGNSITATYDQMGTCYRLPIACVNDPLNYDKDDVAKNLKDKAKPEESQVKGIKIRMLPDKEIKTDFSNQTSIKDVKIQFVQKMKESD